MAPRNGPVLSSCHRTVSPLNTVEMSGTPCNRQTAGKSPTAGPEEIKYKQTRKSENLKRLGRLGDGWDTHDNQQTLIRRENERIVDGHAGQELARVIVLLDQIDGHLLQRSRLFDNGSGCRSSDPDDTRGRRRPEKTRVQTQKSKLQRFTGFDCGYWLGN